MVCSRGKAPAQSQLVHFQRANVALSRARDQCVLVRSLDISDIPGTDDVKVPIIEYFQTFGGDEFEQAVPLVSLQLGDCHPVQRLLARVLTEQGFHVRSMGVVWKNGLCVEHPDSDMRAALMVDCGEGSLQEWNASYQQQKAIERVGWKCLRVDVLSLLSDFRSTLDAIVRFLSASGVEVSVAQNNNGLDDEIDVVDEGHVGVPMDIDNPGDNQHGDVPVVDLFDQGDGAAIDPPGAHIAEDPGISDVVVISSDEENMDAKPASKVKPEIVASGSFDGSDEVDASNFGCVVDLAFLRGGEDSSEPAYGSESAPRSNDYQADQSDMVARASRRGISRSRKYRRLEKYQRDGRWYPNRDVAVDDDPHGRSNDWYDDDNERRNDDDVSLADPEPDDPDYEP